MEGDLEPEKEQQLAAALTQALMRIHLSMFCGKSNLGTFRC